MSEPSPVPTADVLKQRILIEQLELMCRLTPLPLFGSIGVAAILAYLTVADSGWIVAFCWFAASATIMLVRLQVAQAFVAKQRTYEEALRWRTAMFALIVVFGIVWSIPAGFLLPDDPRRETIMTVVFVGATATGLASLAAVRHAYAALLIPFTLPYGATQLLAGGDRTLLGLAFLLYLPVMIAISNRQTNTIARQIRLAIENEALVAALRLERDRTAEANDELQFQLAQQQRSTERIRLLNQDLELRAAELRAANDDLEGFSYSVSHDLRTPLRAIDGFSSLIRQERQSAEPRQLDHYLDRIHENIARMSRLIDDLLSFSRFGSRQLDMLELDMDELVHQAVAEVRALHSMAASATEITISPLPQVLCDRPLMLQVWVNLLDNALKYSSKVAQPKIAISYREDATRLLFEVKDNGVGFDTRYSSKLFGVFERLHAAHEYPGTGVGLAIVRRIVKRHGGEVWAKSEPGNGATFGFSLPKAERVAPDVRIAS
jgi:signal transduction histidine kinase